MADKVITLKELKKHNNSNSAWVAIYNKVYDVTGFLSEHPGGSAALLASSGGYATEGFMETGHSADAIERRDNFLIGQLAQEDREPAWRQSSSPKAPEVKAEESSWTGYVISVGLALCATFLYQYLM